MKRDIQNVDDDIIRKKRIIEQTLYSDEDIIEVLDNSNLDPSAPEDYVYENIFPFIRVPGTQDTSKNFITFPHAIKTSFYFFNLRNLGNTIFC